MGSRKLIATPPGNRTAALLVLLFVPIAANAQSPSPPAITKGFQLIDPAPPLYPGLKANLQFSITNSNVATTLTGVGFIDTLPKGLVVATPNNLIDTHDYQ